MKKRICLVLIFAFLLSGCGILQKRTEEVLSGFLTPEETLQTETVIFPTETQEKGKDKGEMTEPGEETAPPVQEVGIKVAAGRDHTVILYPDGTVAAVGNNDHGQCEVASWRDIVDISCGDRHTVCLRADGTVVCVGDNEENQCRTGNWTDVIAISAGDFHTVGLRSDGTAVSGRDLSVYNVDHAVGVVLAPSHRAGIEQEYVLLGIPGRGNGSAFRHVGVAE